MEFASPWQRFLASLIDTAVFIGLLVLLVLLFPNPPAYQAILDLGKSIITFSCSFDVLVDYLSQMSNGTFLITFVIAFGLYIITYIVVPCITNGQTLGKYIMGIRIVKLSEKKMSFGTLFLRQIVAVILDFYTLGATIIISAFSIFYAKGNRIIHDRMSNTLVVKA